MSSVSYVLVLSGDKLFSSSNVFLTFSLGSKDFSVVSRSKTAGQFDSSDLSLQSFTRSHLNEFGTHRSSQKNPSVYASVRGK